MSEGPKESHLGGVWQEEPCHTGAQCGAPPTRAGHGRAAQSYTGATSRGRGQPPQHQLPLTSATASGGAGRQRSYRHRQPSAASLPRIQPGAAQASRPSARGPGAQGPMLQEEMGGGGDHASSPWWRGVPTDCSRPSEKLPLRPSCRASSEPIQPAPATS